jgi:hypothetical protein
MGKLPGADQVKYKSGLSIGVSSIPDSASRLSRDMQNQQDKVRYPMAVKGHSPGVPFPCPYVRCLAASFSAFFLFALPATAQELEPRAYANLPVGLNFAVAAYAYSKGGLATDPALPVEDAELEIHTGIFAYARSMAFGDRSGKFELIVPASDLSGDGLVAGERRERDTRGFGDPRFRMSFNFRGAPALGLREFAAQPAAERDKLVVGASLQVTPPLGDYDSDKAINLGTNRWAMKPDIGFSKKFHAVTVDMSAGVTFFGDNDDFVSGQTLEQDPIYSIQTNLSYDFGRGIWTALGATYYAGGRTTIEGQRKDTEIGNSRVGITQSLPINRYFSMKFNASRGISTRTGTSFDTVGLGLQYRWGDGL